MKFFLDKKSKNARAGSLHLAQGIIKTPIFMPVGTVGAVKSLDAIDMQEILKAPIILGNTYHLYLRPGDELIKKMGGLHNFTKYKGNFLTDSGGFQAFSLSKISKSDEFGVKFQSHIDGSKHYFTPKKVIDIQTNLNSDIMMVLDDLIALPANETRLDLSIKRTISWAKEALKYKHELNAKQIGLNQNLFAITQGGVSFKHREICTNELVSHNFDGFAIGGLSVGESNHEMYDIVEFSNTLLPQDKPRYLMGVGTPEDLIENIARGVDMFDCVMPTRNARNGSLFTSFGKISIKNARFKDDSLPIDKACSCYTCRNFDRAYLHHLFRTKELTYFRLASLHNLHYYLNLVKEAREAILEDNFDAFRADFYHKRQN